MRTWIQTIILTWQLIVTLDSIRNSCDVYDSGPQLTARKYNVIETGALWVYFISFQIVPTCMISLTLNPEKIKSTTTDCFIFTDLFIQTRPRPAFGPRWIVGRVRFTRVHFSHMAVTLSSEGTWWYNIWWKYKFVWWIWKTVTNRLPNRYDGKPLPAACQKKVQWETVTNRLPNRCDGKTLPTVSQKGSMENRYQQLAKKVPTACQIGVMENRYQSV